MRAALFSIVYRRSEKFDKTWSSLDQNVNAPARLCEIWVTNGVHCERTRLDHTANVLYAYLNKQNIFQYAFKHTSLSPPIILQVTGRRKKTSSVVQRSIVAIFFEKGTMSCPLARKKHNSSSTQRSFAQSIFKNTGGRIKSRNRSV
jgi:hypothetical protein